MADLKLIALGAEDLQVISAHLQDAVVTIGDIAYLPGEKRFAALVNRFDWSEVAADASAGGKPAYSRRRSALRFDRVLGAQLRGMQLDDSKRVLSLLAIQFKGSGPDDPSGFVSLIFAADAAIRLNVECIEAEMRDLGAVWATKSKPEHADD